MLEAGAAPPWAYAAITLHVLPRVRGRHGSRPGPDTGVGETAVATGDVTPLEAEAVLRLLEGHAKVLEVRDLEERIATLELKAGPMSSRKKRLDALETFYGKRESRESAADEPAILRSPEVYTCT